MGDLSGDFIGRDLYNTYLCIHIYYTQTLICIYIYLEIYKERERCIDNSG